MTNVGIVGLGFMAVAHIRGYRTIPEAKIVAVCHPSGRRLDGDLSGVFGNLGSQEPVRLDMSQIKGYRDYGDFLNHPELDLVDICTPTRTHLDLSVRALAAGKHVLCEKPLARSSAEVKRMLAQAEKSDGLFMPAMCLRFWPEWAWLKEAITDRRFGSLRAARFRRLAEPPAWGRSSYFDGKTSGGALFDLHVHDVDFVIHCFGRPTRVLAWGFTQYSGAIDHVVAQYEFPTGATISSEGSWSMTPGFGFNMEYTAVFEKATADYNLARGADALKLYEEGRDPRVLNCEGPNGYAVELQRMIRAISEPSASPISPKDALAAIEVCEAEEKSIHTSQAVTP